jgi:hypothetical protein
MISRFIGYPIIFCVLLCLLAMNCGSGGVDSGNGPGPDITTDNSIKKTISYSILQSDPLISCGSLTAARSSVSSNYVYWMLPVTNNGPTPISFVEFDAINFRNYANSTLSNDQGEFVTGSVMKRTMDGAFTNTCLHSGETGYVFGIQSDNGNNLYSLIVSATIAAVSYSTADLENPKADVSGSSFSISGSIVTLTVMNSGLATAQFDTDVPAIALMCDADNAPLIWTILETTTSLLAPNASCQLSDGSFTYPGRVSNLLPFPNYEDIGSVITHGNAKKQAFNVERKAFASEEAYLVALIAHRNTIETAKKSLQ